MLGRLKLLEYLHLLSHYHRAPPLMEVDRQLPNGWRRYSVMLKWFKWFSDCSIGFKIRMAA